MPFSKTALAVATALSTILSSQAFAAQADETPEQWYQDGRAEVIEALKLRQNNRRAKNVILFVGDGMGVSTVTAARILEGQLRGDSGEENVLAFETLPYVSLSKVYNTNQQTPDSAGTMTAMMTGVKTKAGIIGLNQYAVRGDCDSAAGNELSSFLAQAENAGMSTGVVSTARITHATPAATYAHSPERNWEDWSDMPEEAQLAGCKDIADQLIQFSAGDGIDVVMGGGRRHFLPKDTAYNSGDQTSPVEGDRTDGRDLTAEWQQRFPQGKYVIDQTGFDAINPRRISKLLGLFNESHMQYENDRANDILGEPSLSEMTDKAIDILDNNRRKGFFLAVESGRVDHGHHAGSANYALADTIEFARAIKVAMENTDPRETLIIVTADHSHVFTIAGYPTRGNPILGNVSHNDSTGEPSGELSSARDGLAYTTVSYANGLGFAENLPGDDRYSFPPDTGRHDLSIVDTGALGFHQEALVPLGSETHSGEDVAIYAGGPFAHLFHKTHEQNYIYHVMSHATKIGHKPPGSGKRYHSRGFSNRSDEKHNHHD